MIKVNNNKITMTRGDSGRLLVTPKVDEEDYTPVSGDTMKFYLKTPRMNAKESEYKDPVPLIEKDIPISTMILNLEPEDTKPFGFGEYVYDIELTFANGLVDTFINNETFILAPEVG